MKRLLALGLVLSVATLASAQNWAKSKLEKSPRHIEWVKVKHGSRTVNCSITYPEVKNKATAVLVIHEIFGLTDWVRLVTDHLAEEGYIAIAPDLLSGSVDGTGGTAELGSVDAVRRVVMNLPPDQITADLDAVADYVSKLPSCNGKLVVAGFCWGGGQSFRYATHNKNLKAAYVFYGPPPETESDLANINCPVLGFYGEDDNRINSTIDKTKEQMKAAGKEYDPVIYEGGGHGFMRMGEAADTKPEKKEGSKKAMDAGWKRWKESLKKI